MRGEAIIVGENLSVGYRKKIILRQLDFNVIEGQLIALVGKNGVGKSTLLRTLTTDLPPAEGTLSLAGKPLKEYSRRELASYISIVTTDPIQVGALTVKELVNLGRDIHTGITGRLSQKDKDAVTDAMKCVGIDYKADSYVAHLSDGERQKALIARALAQDTPIIILDEPFSFLDVSARIEILRTLKALCRERQKTVIYSSHDISQALRMADEVWMLTPERKLICGEPYYLIANKLIDKLFNIDDVVFDPSQNDFVAC